jgi:hypothetical protein
MYLSGGFGYRDREGVLHAFIVTVPSATLTLHRFRSFIAAHPRWSPSRGALSTSCHLVPRGMPARTVWCGSTDEVNVVVRCGVVRDAALHDGLRQVHGIDQLRFCNFC